MKIEKCYTCNGIGLKMILFFVFFSLFVSVSWAQDITYNGINYVKLSSNTVAVNSTQSSALSGAVVIPSTVTDGGVAYKVTMILSEAFKGNIHITSIDPGANVYSIGPRAFSGCTALTAVNVTSVLRQIDKEAFANCSALTSFSVPSTLVLIGENVFSGCDGLTTVSINTKKVSDWFAGNTGLQKVTLSGTTAIGKNAFENCSSLTTVENTSSIVTVDDNAFSGCVKLVNLTLPNRCTTIGYKAFCNCESLKSITLSSYLTSISPMAFAGCKSLEKIDIPSNVAEIGQGAFDGCSSITSIILPSSITKIEDYLFNGCESLQKITLNAGTDTIGDKAFGECKSLTSIVIPSTVVDMGFAVFSGCSSLSQVTYESNNMREIRQNMYYGCTALTSFDIPTTPTKVVSVGDFAFAYSGVRSANLTNVRYYLGTSAYEGCANLKLIDKFQDFLFIIRPRVFYGCSSLLNFTSPKYASTISESAFENCSALETVTLNNSVSSVLTSAFKGCSSLKNLYVNSSIPPVAPDKQVFDDWNYTNTKLYVPTGNESSYAKADEWKNFMNITTTDIHQMNVDASKVVARYSLDGRLLASPQKGVAIVRNSDGKIYKVVIK